MGNSQQKREKKKRDPCFRHEDIKKKKKEMLC